MWSELKQKKKNRNFTKKLQTLDIVGINNVERIKNNKICTCFCGLALYTYGYRHYGRSTVDTLVVVAVCLMNI